MLLHPVCACCLHDDGAPDYPVNVGLDEYEEWMKRLVAFALAAAVKVGCRPGYMRLLLSSQASSAAAKLFDKRCQHTARMRTLLGCTSLHTSSPARSKRPSTERVC